MIFMPFTIFHIVAYSYVDITLKREGHGERIVRSEDRIGLAGLAQLGSAWLRLLFVEAAVTWGV